MKIEHLIENLIFVSGEPISINKLSQILETDENKIVAAIENLKGNIEGGGLKIISKDNKIQMVTDPEAAKYIEKFVIGNMKEELSEAALETLAAVSYLGPISKPEIEELRGVNCAFSLRNLLIRGLIEKIEKSGSRLATYKTSFDFLKKLGIEKEDELPDYQKYKEEIKSILGQNQNNQKTVS